MFKKAFILFTWCSILNISVFAQCPDRDFLWQQIADLKGSSKPTTQKELEELLGYLDRINSCPYKNDTTHVALLRLIASTYFQRADYLTSARYRREIIKIISTNAQNPGIKLIDLPGSYFWLSVAYDSVSNVSAKMEALDSCIATSMRLKYVDRSTLVAFESRVLYFFDVGDYQRCIDYARQLQTLGRKYADGTTGIEHTVGEISVYSSVGWQVKALLELKYFRDAEELLQNKLDEYRAAGLKDYTAMIYSQMAGVHEQKGDYRKSLFYFNQSLRYYQDTKDYFNCKQTSKDIGNIYFKHLNDWRNALANFKKALAYINNNKRRNLADAAESLDIYASMANLYAETGRYDLAHYYYQASFDEMKLGANEAGILNSSIEEIKQITKIHYVTALIIDKGDACRKEFVGTKKPTLLTEAIRIYKVADQFLNKIKAGQTDLQSKLFWRSDSRRLYENAIEACYLQHNLEDAFYFFEKSRAVLLQDQLNEQHWSGESDILRQTQLEKRIAQLQRELKSSDKSSSQFSELQNEVFNNEQELEGLRNLIKVNNPLYYQSFVDTNSTSLRDVRDKILKDHHALIELFVGDSAVYLFVVTAQTSYLHQIDKKAFDALSTAYVNYISHSDLLNVNFNNYAQCSWQLHNLLFQNVSLPVGRIIISPGGKYFPFEALVTNKMPLTYFLDGHAVSYTYSARFLLNEFEKKSASNAQAFMGIAPVHYSNGFPPLLGSDQSLQQLGHYFNNPINLTGNKASKNNFLKQYFKYKVIQLYTHATDSGYTGEPTIYFSDSALLLSDLFYESRPITNLIVLSACQTAGGRLYNGEGVFSFNRQFAALGISSSVSNLWQADDQSTYKITELFYKYLSKGLPLDVALQKAKKEFRSISSKERNLPYYWAASILVGRGDPIQLQKPFPWMWAVVIVIALLVVFWGLKMMQRNRSIEFKKLTSVS